MTPPRVLHLVGIFFPKGRGAAYAALRLAGTLRERGVEAEFLVDEESSGGGSRGGDHEGFPVRPFRLYTPGKAGKLRGLAGLTAWAWRRRRDFRILHVHGGGHVNITLAWWLRRLTGWRVLFKTTSDGWDTPDGVAKDKYGRWLMRCYRTFDRVVAMTSGQAAKVRAASPGTAVEVVPNGVDCARYHPLERAPADALRRELDLPAGAPVLLYVGWLGKGKGSDVLFRVWQRVRARHPDAFLLCVGDYLHEGEAGRAALFRELELAPPPPGPWRIVGRVGDVERYMQAADLFVFPSRQEGFGTVQIEAMACGLPCVVNDLPGVSADLFPDEQTGFRIAGNDEDAFVARILGLLADPARRAAVGAAARRRAETSFSRDVVATRYLGIYEDLA